MSPSKSDRLSFQPDWRRWLEEIYRDRSLYPFEGGQPIPLYPHEIWVVSRGVVQLTTLHSSGDEVLLGFVCPSMPFGLPLTNLEPYQAIALSDADLMRLTVMEVEQSPQLSKGIVRHLVRRLQQTEALLALVNHRRVEDRLRQLLRLLQREVGQETKEGTRLTVRLTHQHLANAIGSTRVTVTRALGQLQEEGWLSVDRSRHIVLHEALPEAAETGLEMGVSGV
ncbi:MAG: Crp/Fnr family transcriptional regulator [Oscillatoriales cyanobacterium SM2_1_8]|nr:Crp/Fnr family transcriptional regulator [Oscillatoriales cyanobacterium SM2_1_8]